MEVIYGAGLKWSPHIFNKHQICKVQSSLKRESETAARVRGAGPGEIHNASHAPA